ncbi:MAG: tyrosine-type recombinase/integrase [Gemmataceae bacterium]
MAWIEQRGAAFRIKFRFSGRNLSVALKTDDETEAQGLLARFEENLRLLNRGRLVLPPAADVGLFLLSDGKLSEAVSLPPLERTIGEVFDLYRTTLTAGAKEANTLKSEAIHLAHLRRILKSSTPVSQVTTQTIQAYVDRRAKERYRRKPIRSVTIKKEVATFQTVWNWAVRRNHLATASPVKGITFPKEHERPPFRTFEQIQKIIDRGGLTKAQTRELWSGLFLNLDEVREVLVHVRQHAACAWLHPFLVAAAHTGARRSELMRARIEDFDFTNKTVVLREKKTSRVRDTFRTVDMTPTVESVLADYLNGPHPGGVYMFSADGTNPVSDRATRSAFVLALAGSKWSVLRGYHVFRHSFASNLAAAGIDEHVISGLMGHLTAEMRARYRHLFPTQRRAAIAALFG